MSEKKVGISAKSVSKVHLEISIIVYYLFP